MAPEAVRASADDEDETSGIMRPRRHGTCAAEPGELRWSLSAQLASSIACFNRRGAEPSGSYEASADFLEAAAAVAAATPQGEATITFYDAATRRPLFIAPRNRTMDDFLVESKRHGWKVRSGGAAAPINLLFTTLPTNFAKCLTRRLRVRSARRLRLAPLPS